MENYWGRLKEPQKVSLANSTTKAAIRQRVWEFLERNDLANFPRPVYNRIPNFKGASRAAANLTEQLQEFRDARTIKVNPDKPQEEVRFKVLEAGKTLMVPTPRLSQGLFNRLEPDPEDSSKDRLRQLASRHGIDNLSKPIPMASRIKLDMVVIGSVAVDRLGHRIGKGEGFADLEFAMAASHHSAITEDTLVVTTVHDCQVFDNLPEDIFQSHDLSVDVIVTPTEVFRISERLKKPDGIQWGLLTREKFEGIPILKEIQYKEMKGGKDTRLKGETHQQREPREPREPRGDRGEDSRGHERTNGASSHSNGKKDMSNAGESGERNSGHQGKGSKNHSHNKKNPGGGGNREGGPREGGPRRQNSSAKSQHQRGEGKHSKGENGASAAGSSEPSGKSEGGRKNHPGGGNKGGSSNRGGGGGEGGGEGGKEGGEKKSNQQQQQKKSSSNNAHHLGVFVGRIPRQARTKDLRDAVVDRGLKPAAISWKGAKGFAFMYFDTRANNLPSATSGGGEELVEKLKDLKIGDTVLNIEQDRRSSKKNSTKDGAVEKVSDAEEVTT